ncbi:hypothetical protein GQ607_005752 [Colletotrichum asianum]|uniref:Uncharacterized protein n=1 Tax=Colletotrichum asianum TaxID=702518 RepID=A0A8H3WM76_9PEZI|nr:hypothetical protein GQ607_005752 [Colletotrichum asianum]
MRWDGSYMKRSDGRSAEKKKRWWASITSRFCSYRTCLLRFLFAGCKFEAIPIPPPHPQPSGKSPSHHDHHFTSQPSRVDLFRGCANFRRR